MTMHSIANLHLAFNLGCTAVLLPFHRQLVRLVERLVPGGGEELDLSILDERFLSTPALALEQAHETVLQMGTFAKTNTILAGELAAQFDAKKLDRLNETERTLDKLEGLLDAYLVQLTDQPLSPEESMRVTELLHTLSDFERIGDYAVNISECAGALHNRGLVFSPQAQAELSAICGAVNETLERTLLCCRSRLRADAAQVEPLEEVVDLLAETLKNRHIERLKRGECTIELGTQFLELLINLERISDHCSNVALRILRETASRDDMIRIDAHTYVHALHHGADREFDRLFAQYRKTYFEPIAAEDGGPS